MTKSTNSDPRLSRRAAGIEASGIRRMFELSASMSDPINLSIGQADFDPPPAMVEAAVAALRAGHHRYSVTEGLPRLNAGLLDQAEGQWGVRPEASMVTTGVSGGLLLAFLTLLDVGDTILIPEPYFVLYRHLAGMLGIEVATYDTYPDFRIRREALEAARTGHTRALLVNSPQNPTGVVLSREELETIASFARENELVVISDEIYAAFVYDAPFPSMLQADPGAIVLGGFSKTYGVPGWRLGYAFGPEPLVDKMRTLQQFSYVCAPVPLQHAAIAALDIDMSEEIAAYRRKRDLVVEALRGHLDVVTPGGSFYAFPALPEGVSSGVFVKECAAHDTLVVPGDAFSARGTHFRLSFAIEDSKLRRGLDVLRDAAHTLRRAGA